MDRRANDFHTTVQMLIGDGEEKAKLYQIMRDYHRNKNLTDLVTKLKVILCTPKRLAVFQIIRQFVPPAQQQQYDVLCPPQISKEIRKVRLVRKDVEPLGFRIRGGAEYGVGVYISEVFPKSQADRQGLKAGDEILRVNGFKLSQAIQSEVVALMNIRRDLVIKVRSVGMTPIKNGATDPIKWKFVTDVAFAATSFLDDVLDSFESPVQSEKRSGKNTVKIDLSKGDPLGCGISTNESGNHGVFVHRVSAGSLADKAGIKPGNQILEANGVDLTNASHADAIKAIKSRTSLVMVLVSKEVTAVTNRQHKQRTSNDTPKKPAAPSVTGENWWTNPPENMFTDRQIDGRDLRKIELKCNQLDFEVEGGKNSPLMGKIMVSDVQPDGAADKSGQINKGDQIMLVDGKTFIDISLKEAETFLEGQIKKNGKIRVIVAVSHIKNFSDDVTFF
ncbi:harmonin-like [Anneissia japonica]|uniref:harmonin-like n=1 Tax=Anneissia japonica TaxID=1529436 RepID=UPI0014258E8F|nr:harmonin-like [Anneissia japonica]